VGCTAMFSSCRGLHRFENTAVYPQKTLNFKLVVLHNFYQI